MTLRTADIEVKYRLAVNRVTDAFTLVAQLRMELRGGIPDEAVLRHLGRALTQLVNDQHEAAAAYGFDIKTAAGNQLVSRKPPHPHHTEGTDSL